MEEMNVEFVQVCVGVYLKINMYSDPFAGSPQVINRKTINVFKTMIEFYDYCSSLSN